MSLPGLLGLFFEAALALTALALARGLATFLAARRAPFADLLAFFADLLRVPAILARPSWRSERLVGARGRRSRWRGRRRRRWRRRRRRSDHGLRLRRRRLRRGLLRCSLLFRCSLGSLLRCS